jgi:cell division protease FtsH
MGTKKQNPKVVKGIPMKKLEFRFNFNLRRILVWFLIFLLFVPGLLGFLGGASLFETLPISEVINEVREKRVERVEIKGEELVLYYPEKEGVPQVKLSRLEPGTSFLELLQREEIDPASVKIDVSSQTASKIVWGMISFLAPILGFGLLMFLLMRQRGGGADMVFGIGKSKAKLFAKGKQSVKFAGVAGVDEAKKELEEIVDFLKNPKKYRLVGARTPKGVLLTGPSGVGKTLLARAVAGEAGVPFFSMAGSEFMEMLVGVGASRVRDLFETAKKASPSIIFIDEIDAIGRTRGMGGTVGGHDEREQTLNQILVEMDGFTANDNVIVIAATNRPDVLDPALVRPGRFDRRVTLDLPDIAGRKDIVKIHAQGKPFDKEVDWDKVAKRTVGFSGADLENMLNEAAIRAARFDRKEIMMVDLEEAALRVKFGLERKRLMSQRERKMVAYHEIGHAIIGHLLPGNDPIRRVSIVSRGMALGYTMSQPDSDKYQQTESEFKDQIAVILGGRAAEKLVFNELTAGAASDIDKATRLARAMVVEFGMSRLGPIALGPSWETSDWGKAYMEPVKVSEATQAKVDVEVKRFVDEGYKLALKVIQENRKVMDKLVERLLVVETIEQEEFEKIVGIKKKNYEDAIVN